MKTMRSAAASLLTGAVIAVGGIVAVASSAAAAPFTSNATITEAAVDATFSNTTLKPGDQITTTLEFTNLTGAPDRYRYWIGFGGTSFGEVFQLDGCQFPAGVPGSCSVGGGELFEALINALPPGNTVVTVDLTVKQDVSPAEYPFVQTLQRNLDSWVSFAPPLTITVPEPEADVAVDLRATAGPLLGSQISYRLTAANDGPGDVAAATVTIDLPAQTYSTTGLPPECSYTSAADRVTCATGAVPAGGAYTATFRVNLGLLSVGALNATATRSTSLPTDPNASNDTDSADCSALLSLLINCPAETA